MNNFPFIRDARVIELDILDILEVHKGEDLRPTLQTVAHRVGILADKLELLCGIDDKQKKDALRWELLFDTPGIRLRKVGSQLHLYQDELDVFGRVSSSRLLAVGSDKVDLVDRALGFIK